MRGTPPSPDDLVAVWAAPTLFAASHADSEFHAVADFSQPGVDPFHVPLVTMLFAVGDHLLFTVAGRDGSLAFWTSDGTAEGTRPIPGLEFPAGSALDFASPTADGALLAVARGGGGTGLWSTGGTAENTRLVREFGAEGIWRIDSAPLGGFTYFSVVQPDDHLRVDLWRTDGTPNGTTLVKTGVSQYGESTFARAGETLLVLGYTGTQHLWRSDGTGPGTQAFFDVYFPDSIGYLQPAGDRAYFFSENVENGGNDELWSTDGTAAGTSRVSPVASWLSTSLNGAIFFVADDGAHGAEPWITNGSPEGTRLLADVAPGVAGANPLCFSVIDGLVLFAADDGSGTGIWRSDGTPEGTWKVLDGHAGAPWTFVAGFAEAGNDIYFVALTGNDRALWRMPKYLLAPERSAAPAVPVIHGRR